MGFGLRRIGLLVGVLSVTATVGVPATAAAARPRATQKAWVDLGPGQAYGINNADQVVGSVGGSGSFRAVMWQNGKQVELGSLPGLKECGASAINNAGQVVGQCSNASFSVSHAFLWSRGAIKDLGTLPGSSDSGATAISQSGDIAGVSTPQGDSRQHAVLWRNGAIRDLGVLGSGYVQSIARGINNGDQVVGWSTQSSGFEQAFVWANGTMHALKAPTGTQSEASGIDNEGHVAGGLLGGGLKPALWAGGPAIELPTLGRDASALAVNQGGELAGWVDTAGGGTHAAMWVGRKLIDLGSVRGGTTIAASINDNGEVAGRTELSQGDEAVALLESRPQGSRRGAKPPGRGRIDAFPGVK
jgi:probable HAF family extracellular repeat protein